jgi:hypothetical protein
MGNAIRQITACSPSNEDSPELLAVQTDNRHFYLPLLPRRSATVTHWLDVVNPIIFEFELEGYAI